MRGPVLITFSIGLCALGGAAAATPDATPGALLLSVDATEAPRGILHARLQIPVKPGPLTLYYPKWIPGEHGPSGPIVNLAGLRIKAGDREVPWERDPADMYAFRVVAPVGADRLEVGLDALQGSKGTFSAGGSTTSELAVVNWNQLLVYPETPPPDQLTVIPSLELPAGWKYGTALETAAERDRIVRFSPVSLTTLVDSPVLAGAHHRRIDLAPGQTPPAAIDIACDGEAGLAASPELIAAWRRLINEGGALFGARHYRRYDFLLALSDHVAHFGLEHHESSDDRLHERALVDDQLRKATMWVLSHEYVHSWVGKYRQPAGLVRPDFQKPIDTELLWVYEGLTQYLGFVLAARSGLVTPEWALDWLARLAGRLDKQPGRSWRALRDTAVAAQILWGAPSAWSSWRRGVDFYDEGLLIWLEADALIRRKTGGARSLDDFCRLFAGGKSGPPEVVPHTFDDVIDGLTRVAAHNWRAFLTSRIDSVTTDAPLGGITASGWRLTRGEALTDEKKADEKAWEYVDESFSIGIALDKDGVVSDVVPGSPAAKAGMGPGVKPLAVNGRRFNVDRLREELRASKDRAAPFEIIAEQGDVVRSFSLEWRGGAVYPTLVRDESMPDLLSEILKPLTPPVAPETAAAPKKP